MDLMGSPTMTASACNTRKSKACDREHTYVGIMVETSTSSGKMAVIKDALMIKFILTAGWHVQHMHTIL